MKIIKGIFALLTVIVVAWGGLMFWQGLKSKQTTANIGLENGSLKPCGDKPNCISSVNEAGSPFFFRPIESENIEVTWDNLNILLPELGFTIVKAEENYIHATATTAFFRFVDDMEFLLNEANNKIFVRSQSRVGYSDMGTNRKRMHHLVHELMNMGQGPAEGEKP
ncbi:MAG: DUF1499 domain-containing protein [Bdellovibrionales bacterium]|nr:DUF1499 domain-containing protein [Bdellovibrionales bacterium]